MAGRPRAPESIVDVHEILTAQILQESWRLNNLAVEISNPL